MAVANYSSNYNLILKIKGVSDRIEQIQDEAGGMLVRNIRAEARKRLKGGDGKYPYDFSGSFQKDEVVHYDKDQKAVFVDHPAAKRLEYGFGQLKIKPKNAEKLHFKGQDGEDVYADEVIVSATKPVGYARAAIKETLIDVRKRFKEVMA